MDDTVRKFMVRCTDPHHYWAGALARGIENAVYAMTCVHDTVVTEITPKIVCLCGSTRFKDEFTKANADLTLQGHIVLSVGMFGHVDAPEIMTTDVKVTLDELHKRKIDLADEVFVINVGGYIGDSTRSEIEYALAQHKVVSHLEPL